MSRNYICNGKKYEVGGPKLDTIGLPVYLENLPTTLSVEGYNLQIRTSFHVSLICIGKIVERYNVPIPDFVEKVKADFCEYTKTTEIKIKRFTGEFRFVTQNERRSVVAMCDMDGLEDFFDILDNKYGLDLEYPPTHVTLYTLQPNMGIFLVDSFDLGGFTKVISNPIGRNL